MNEWREMTEDELDVEGETQRLMFAMGGCLMIGRDGKGRVPELSDMVWRLIPFIKAISSVALENPGRVRHLWAKALQEPMPFGGAPLGVPLRAPEASPDTPPLETHS